MTDASSSSGPDPAAGSDPVPAPAPVAVPVAVPVGAPVRVVADPAGSAPTAEAPRGQSSTGAFLVLILALAVGLGVRLAYAGHPGMAVDEWEADGFVTTWEGRPWGSLNRVRAPGLALALTEVGRSLPVPGVLDVRWVSIGLSLLGLMAACLCASSLAAISGLKRRSMVRACAWVSALWAVHPTLIMSSVSPTPELLTGLAACLTVAGFGYVRRSPGVLSWLSCTLAAGLFIVAGGILAAVAVVVGVVVYLMPVPRAGRACAVLLGLAVALGLGWWSQAGPDEDRPWLPDTAWAYSVRAMLEAPSPHRNDVPTAADLRARQALLTVRDAVAQAEPGEVARLWLGRVAFQLLGAPRFEPLADAIDLPVETPMVELEGPPSIVEQLDSNVALGLGLLDLFLRGGLLLFALTVIRLVRRGGATSCWPRAGVVVGALAWLMLLALGAIGPVAVAPFDLLLLGVAGAGVAGGDPTQAWTRRLAFAVGGVLLASFLWTAGWNDEPLEAWLTDIDLRSGEGRYLVTVLQDGGPIDGEGQFAVANFMTLWNLPLLRMPEPANVRAAEAWKLLAPTERGDEAIELLVRTLVECQRYTDAARLAEDFHASLGTDDRRSLLLLHWVQDEQRKWENLPIRRP